MEAVHGATFNGIVRAFVLDGFSDTQCGFKLFAGDAARHLFGEARIDRFAFDVEILALALKRGYRVLEVPITWVNSPASRLNPVLDSLHMLWDLARIRLAIGGEMFRNSSTMRMRIRLEEMQAQGRIGEAACLRRERGGTVM